MLDPDPKIGDKPRQIRALDPIVINQIAAGEVVERPASAVKELIENALDAGASAIEVSYDAGGKTLLQVVDDGHGIPAAELPLALERHATSKIDGTDLLNIASFGFRGEALAALAASGRLLIRSRFSHEAAEIAAEFGRLSPVRPAAMNRGTRIELRDLFANTPARLKFLRTDRAEAQAIGETVRRLALAEPRVSFQLRDIGSARTMFRVDAEQGDETEASLRRVAKVLGHDFADNAIAIKAEREGIRLTGFAALPTYSRGSAVQQFFFVNGRPVRDKLLLGALRAAYSDVLSRGRHPAAVMFVDCPLPRVDQNVHPAKSEVRFREPGVVRGLIVSGLRHALAEAGHKTATTVSSATLGAFQDHAPSDARVYQMDRTAARPINPGFAEFSAPGARVEEPAQQANDALDRPLGAARAQLHETYIVSQTKDGIVLVDQHAAHERLVYEKLKRQYADRAIARQVLLIPSIVKMSAEDCQRILDHSEALAQFGLVIESFGGDAIAVRETPAVLGQIDAESLLRDVLDELSDLNQSEAVEKCVNAMLSRMSCHGSIRAGRRMGSDEMNALLREMEETPLSGQCNHGRPTYVSLKLSDVERLFGRS